MKIKTGYLSFNPPYAQMYFIIKTEYDCKQIKYLLQQINTFNFGSSSNIVMPLSYKLKYHIQTHPQPLHNGHNQYVIYAFSSKSKIQKVISSVALLGNVEVDVQECFIVHGKVKQKKEYSDKFQKKTLQLCEPANCIEGYQPGQTFKTKSQDELLAYVSAFQNAYKIEVSGNSITVFPTKKQTVRQPSDGYVARFIKKNVDGLKLDKSVLQNVLELSYGIKSSLHGSGKIKRH